MVTCKQAVQVGAEAVARCERGRLTLRPGAELAAGRVSEGLLGLAIDKARVRPASICSVSSALGMPGVPFLPRMVLACLQMLYEYGEACAKRQRSKRVYPA